MKNTDFAKDPSHSKLCETVLVLDSPTWSVCRTNTNHKCPKSHLSTDRAAQNEAMKHRLRVVSRKRHFSMIESPTVKGEVYLHFNAFRIVQENILQNMTG